MKLLRHRSVALAGFGWWDYDVDLEQVRASFVNGQLFVLPICSSWRPRLGGHPIEPINATAWWAVPSRRYVRIGERLEVHQEPFVSVQGDSSPATLIVLLDAPVPIAAAFRELIAIVRP